MSDRAQAEIAWPALISALHRAEAADFDPANILARLADPRELRSTPSASETLAIIRINRYFVTHPAIEHGQAGQEPPLPWMAHPATAGSGTSATNQYLNDATDLITARVNELASTAVRHRPPVDAGPRPATQRPRA
jgi:hypothetical protein